MVGTTVCVRSNSWSSNSGHYLCVECMLNGASNCAWLSVDAFNCPVAQHTVRCMRNIPLGVCKKHASPTHFVECLLEQDEHVYT